MPRIIDAIIAFNEIDMILTRMHILKDVVDIHVVVEAETTHSGEPKPLYIAEAMDAGVFDEFIDKIMYANCGQLIGTDSWMRERLHRHSIGNALRNMAHPGDLVIVADADEIPNPDTLLQVQPDGAKLDMSFCYYDFHHHVNQGWGICVVPYHANLSDTNGIRNGKGYDHLPTLEDGGWHLSYFLTPEQVVQKVNAFMHHGDIAANMPRDPVWVAERMKRGEDLFGRGIQIDYIPQPEGLPAYVLANRERYTALGWLET